MTSQQKKRNPRYTRTVGEKPNHGRRYVENGKVRIEWYEDGKRRSRTIGPNSAETRREADETLMGIVGIIEPEVEPEEKASEATEMPPILDTLRDYAESLLDAADDLADAVERGLIRALRVLSRSEEPKDEE